MLRRRSSFLLVLGAPLAWAGAFLAGACNTPYIPVPPPSEPTFAPLTVSDGAGGTKRAWEARGTAIAGHKVYLYNTALGIGVITRSDLATGAYVIAPFDGREGDRVELFTEDAEGRASEITCVLLAPGRGVRCPPR